MFFGTVYFFVQYVLSISFLSALLFYVLSIKQNYSSRSIYSFSRPVRPNDCEKGVTVEGDSEKDIAKNLLIGLKKKHII